MCDIPCSPGMELFINVLCIEDILFYWMTPNMSQSSCIRTRINEFTVIFLYDMILSKHYSNISIWKKSYFRQFIGGKMHNIQYGFIWIIQYIVNFIFIPIFYIENIFLIYFKEDQMWYKVWQAQFKLALPTWAPA